MTEMAPEQPIPEGVGTAQELEVDYVLTEDSVLTVTASLGGARLELALDYTGEDPAPAADFLVAALPQAVQSVFAAIAGEGDEENADG